MSDPYERITNHELRDASQALRTAVGSLNEDARLAANDTEPQQTLERAIATADWAEGLLDVLDPLLVPTAALDPLVPPMRSAADSVTLCADDPAHVANVAQYLDQLFSQASVLSLATPAVRDTASSVARGFGIALGHRVRALRGEIEGAEQALSSLRAEVDQARADEGAQLQQHVDALEARLEELQTAVTDERLRVDQLVSTFQAEHVAAQKERADEFTDAEAIREAEAKRVVERLEDLFARTTAKLDESTAATIDLIESRKRKVEELYEIVVKAGTAGAFAREARTERERADRWRVVAVILGLAAIAVAGFAAFVLAPRDDNWHDVVTKLAVTVALGTVAAYAGKQSSRHRQREESAKQLELDLTAIGPFIEELAGDDPEKRDKVLTGFVDRWFASRVQSSNHGSDKVVGLSPSDLVELLRQAVSR